MNKRINITILGLLTAWACIAQGNNNQELSDNYPDSLTLETENKNEIIFMFNRMGRDKEYFNNELWKSIMGVMETAIARSEYGEGILAVYRKKNDDQIEINISPLDPDESVFTIRKDEMREKLASRKEFLIVLPQVAASFFVHTDMELTEIKELDVASVWSQIAQKYENQGTNNLYRGTGTIKYGTASIDEITDYRPKLDQMELTLIGVGLGFYRDRFVPDIGSKISFHMFNRLGKDWIDFGVLYTNQFFYSQDEAGDFKLNPNGWLSGFAKIHAPAVGEFGLGIGGLIHRKGDFYQGSTYKVSVYNKYKNSRFTFSPEFVFTDDFKDFFPALRVGLSF